MGVRLRQRAADRPRRRACSSARCASSTSTTTTTTRASARSTSSTPRPPARRRSSSDCCARRRSRSRALVAEALYVGLVTDTGRFQYSNTTPEAFRLAARLVEAGAQPARVFAEIWETVPFAKQRLLGIALEHARLEASGKLLVTWLTRDDYASAGADEPFSEGVVDHLRAVEGVTVAALVREPRELDGPQPQGLAARSRRGRRRLEDRTRTRRRRARRRRRLHERRDDAGDRRVPARERDVSAGGALLVDKPAGPTSHDVVARRAARARAGCARRARRHARPVRDGPAGRPVGPLDAARAVPDRPRQALSRRRAARRALRHGRPRRRARAGARGRRCPSRAALAELATRPRGRARAGAADDLGDPRRRPARARAAPRGRGRRDADAHRCRCTRSRSRTTTRRAAARR